MDWDTSIIPVASAYIYSQLLAYAKHGEIALETDEHLFEVWAKWFELRDIWCQFGVDEKDFNVGRLCLNMVMILFLVKIFCFGCRPGFFAFRAAHHVVCHLSVIHNVCDIAKVLHVFEPVYYNENV